MSRIPTVTLLQHIPTFVEGVDPKFAHFQTDDLEADHKLAFSKIDWVQAFAKLDGFVRFSMSGNHLMAEFGYTGQSWVVGYFDYQLPFMPAWRDL